jgi:hypothetical protein
VYLYVIDSIKQPQLFAQLASPQITGVVSSNNVLLSPLTTLYVSSTNGACHLKKRLSPQTTPRVERFVLALRSGNSLPVALKNTALGRRWSPQTTFRLVVVCWPVRLNTGLSPQITLPKFHLNTVPFIICRADRLLKQRSRSRNPPVSVDTE